MAIGSPIDASIRRAALVREARGNIVPDSSPKLAATPQLIMEPGVERFALKFADDLGLTDAYGNTYDGYAAAGGASSITVTQDPPQSIQKNKVDAATDKQILVFDDVDDLYLPRDIDFFAELPLVDDPGSAQDQQILRRNSFGTYDSIFTKVLTCTTGIIKTPENKVYRIIPSLPWDIIGIDGFVYTEAGPATLIVPTGSIPAGSPVDIELTGVTLLTSFLTFQFNFTLVIEFIP